MSFILSTSLLSRINVVHYLSRSMTALGTRCTLIACFLFSHLSTRDPPSKQIHLAVIELSNAHNAPLPHVDLRTYPSSTSSRLPKLNSQPLTSDSLSYLQLLTNMKTVMSKVKSKLPKPFKQRSKPSSKPTGTPTPEVEDATRTQEVAPQDSSQV